MYQVEGYWKVRLAGLLILAILAVVLFLSYSINNSSQEANEIYDAIICVDRLGTAL